MYPDTTNASPWHRGEEVHVWRAFFSSFPGHRDRFLKLLSPDEHERAARFIFPEPREHFIIARGILRTLLTRYTGCEAAGHRFTYGPHGKPALEAPSAPLSFNLTHSDDILLIAIARNGPVGIDVERVRESTSFMQIAKRFYTSREYEQITSLPEEQKREAFYRCWTFKEACAKALGAGMWKLLPLLEVPVTVGIQSETLPVMLEETRWGLTALDMAPSFRGAIALPHGQVKVTLMDFTL
jgi:4'-phosphopantetheinyl transferase